MSIQTPEEGVARPGLGVLLGLKLRLLRNQLRQLTDRSPLQLLMVIGFLCVIWGGLYLVFDHVFVFIRRFDEQAIIAIPYIFHLFFISMTFLLAFSTAVLIYGSLFSREEPSFLLSAPNSPRNVVSVIFIESLFYSSWSLVLLGLPLMMAVGRVEGLPWHFYATFVLAFLGFVPIPGALGMLVALVVAMYMPRIAKRTIIYTAGVSVTLLMVWWGRLWTVSAVDRSQEWLEKFLGELHYVKSALLPSSWPSQAIQMSMQDRPWDAAFYLVVTVTTGLFLSYWLTLLVGRKLLVALGRANASSSEIRVFSGWTSRWFTRAAFFYLPVRMRALILKDMRNFLRDPVQWSQLAILFGLLGLYLFYLPRNAGPQGFSVNWKAVICFLNFGAVTLILSTFTSRFVYPLVSLEGQQAWLVGLWPMPRGRVVWAKFFYALTLTTAPALIITWMAIRAIELPMAIGVLQALATVASCVGLCSLAIGLGARMPNFEEPIVSRITSGFGGTVNLIASIGFVTVNVALFGVMCWQLVVSERMHVVPLGGRLAFAGILVFSLGVAVFCMRLGVRSFQKQEF